MIRIALVEDEAAVRAQLQGYVQRHTRQYGTEFAVTEFADGMELLDDYRPVYDILFLDVEMKHLDGMETARRVRELDKDVIIVFITNMAQYAIGGYAVGALDYVLKPVPYFAFSQQLRKAEEQLRRRARHYLALPVEGGMRRLDSSLIYYLESEGHRVHFYTEEGDFVAAGTLKAFEEKLAERPFARCNSGYLVNLAQVKSVQQGMVQVHDGTAQHPAPVYGAGRVSGRGHLRPAAGPPLRQNGHHRCQCGMGAGPECFFAGHGQRSAGVVDPLHGGSCGDTVFIPLGHPHHLPAGSGLCLRPGLRSGRAGGQRRVAAALLPLASAQRGRRPVTAASGGGLRRRFRLHLGAGA